MLVNGGRSAASFLLMFDIIALSKSCEHLLCIFNSAILILVELTSRHNILSDTVLLINLKKKCCSTSQVHQRSVRYNFVPCFWKHTTHTHRYNDMYLYHHLHGLFNHWWWAGMELTNSSATISSCGHHAKTLSFISIN